MNNTNLKLGLVKWFGGYNFQKEKENDYGFIQSMSDGDVFIHKNEIKSEGSLDEGDLIFFEIDKNKNKISAKNLYKVSELINTNPEVVLIILDIHLKYKYTYRNFFSSKGFRHQFIDLLSNDSSRENTDISEQIRLAILKDTSIFRIIRDMYCHLDCHIYSYRWKEKFQSIVGKSALHELLRNNIDLSEIPQGFINKQEVELYEHIKGLDDSHRGVLFSKFINSIPVNVVLTSVVENLLTDKELILSRYTDISNIFEDRFRGLEVECPTFLDNALRLNFKGVDDYKNIPIIWKIIEPLLFKKNLYQKNFGAFAFFSESNYLKNDIEFFILSNLFSLIITNGATDAAYRVFLHRLWEALSNEDIDFNDESLFNLFPACASMGRHDLSCEAVYWSKAKEYLCRGKRCGDPQINPDIKKHYLDYNIFDWFQHYGVNYLVENEPSKKDFPIKLAGYLNRLKEIFSILHCRECNNLMKPDMRYARVEYMDYEGGNLVKKNMAAAYRATVFECGSIDCSEYEEKYYINHCIGFGCSSIIDTRDLKIKCGNGLYICKGCGSCCEQHAKENPVGSCPYCGKILELFESVETNHYGKHNRRVKCSNTSCNFKIDSGSLPKKFHMASCLPVKRVVG